mgnify:CR=1 FL=1
MARVRKEKEEIDKLLYEKQEQEKGHFLQPEHFLNTIFLGAFHHEHHVKIYKVQDTDKEQQSHHNAEDTEVCTVSDLKNVF